MKYGLLGLSIVALITYCYMGYMRQSAESIFAVFPLLAVLITPILGSYLDHHGKAASMLVLGSILLIACHLTFAFVLPMFKGNAVGGIIIAYATILVLGASFSQAGRCQGDRFCLCTDFLDSEHRSLAVPLADW